ncbi:hypothetical protein AAMO2058_001284500 [Amorphochlora amoebiformis]
MSSRKKWVPKATKATGSPSNTPSGPTPVRSADKPSDMASSRRQNREKKAPKEKAPSLGDAKGRRSRGQRKKKKRAPSPRGAAASGKSSASRRGGRGSQSASRQRGAGGISAGRSEGRGRRHRGEKRERGERGGEQKDRKQTNSAPPEAKGESTMSSEIARELENDSYSCAVCTETIGKREAVWSCSRCFVIFHLQCVRSWSQSSIPGLTNNDKDGVSPPLPPDILRKHKWRCPGCQFVVTGVPRVSKCFCGKTSNPPYQNFLTPHACDKICGKSRGFGCSHPCNSPCHPGACPPCEVVKPPKKCACGKTAFRMRCGQDTKKIRLCGNVCEKPLECFKHKCKRTCHAGECGPCTETELQSCFCGKKVDVPRPCGSGVFTKDDGKRKFGCESKCGKRLACGNHYCTKRCHDGACPPCGRTPKTKSQTCACEQSISFKPEHRRKLCTDPIWTCNKTCARPLPCGHKCGKPCHDSPCGPCGVVEQIACGVKCCPALTLPSNVSAEHIAHKCTRECNKRLKCGHLCNDTCHAGRCRPCTRVLFDGVSCPCGGSKLPGPQRCGTKPPKCNRPCSRPRKCGHPCRYTCHEGKCPPCVTLTTKPCYGGHTTLKNQACHKPRMSCGRICGRILKCKIHKCTRVCHSGDCSKPKQIQPGPLPLHLPPPKPKEEKQKEEITGEGKNLDAWDDDEYDGEEIKTSKPTPTPPEIPSEVWSCGEPCGRPKECGHRCMSVCHPTHPCPKVLCREKVIRKCKCGRISISELCGVKTIPPCNEACAKAERNRRLREALGLGDDGKEKGARASLPFPEDILSSISRLSPGMMAFLEKTESKLEAFVKDDTSPSTMWMPNLNAPKRWLLSCAAGPMDLQLDSSVASTKGHTGRSVRVTKSIMSAVPRVRLSQAVAKYKADPLSVQTTPESQLVRIHGLDAKFVTAPDLKSYLHRFEDKSCIFMLGEGRAVISFTKIQAAQDAAALLTKKGLYASAVPLSAPGGPPGGPKPSGNRRRRRQKAATNWDDEPTPQDAKWVCSTCTFLNPAGKHTCDMCALPRVSVTEGAVNQGSAAPLLRTKKTIKISNPWDVFGTEEK